jgi:hypothetical protein
MRTSGNVLVKPVQVVCICVIILAGFLCIQKSTSAASAGPNVLFILDGSGSMWGRLDNVEKIVIAKERMAELVQELEGVNMGLIVYGHRRKGDCDDIEIMVPLGAGNKVAVIQQIQSISPKGKTPITKSLELAAQQLETIEEETEIVLVSDGLETCKGDPCAYVKSLKDKGINFKMDVVGFDVSAKERGQLECIAKAGGGRYFSAQNAMQLKEAFTEVKKEVNEKVEVASTLDRDLVIYYPFNGNANDKSGNGNHGNVNGATLTEDREGNAKSAYRFNGNRPIISTNNVEISGNRERTIAAWIQWHSLHKNFVLIAGWGKSWNNGRFAIVTERNKRSNCNDKDRSISIWLWGMGCDPELNSTVVPQLEKWYHVVGVYDAKVTKIYLDGKLNNTKTVNLRTGTSLLSIGSDRFRGIIDDVRVYNRALSDSDIQELYHKTSQ